jgi:hypothetical protein
MMVIFNVGWVLKIASNTHQASKFITMNIKIIPIHGPDINFQIFKKSNIWFLYIMAIFKFFQKSQITWNWKSSKKYIPTQHWLYCKKTPSLIKIFKSFHQFLPMYGGGLYCRRLPKIGKFSKVLATLCRTLHIL